MGLIYLIFGVTFLEETTVNKALGYFVSLMGLLLFTPIFVPEASEDIADVVCSKYIDYWKITVLRLVAGMIVFGLLLFAYAGVLYANGSIIGFHQIGAAFANTIFLGSIGLVGMAVFNGITTGYMLALIYYIMNFFIPNKLGIFYLFSVDEHKLLLGSIGVLLIITAIIIKQK